MPAMRAPEAPVGSPPEARPPTVAERHPFGLDDAPRNTGEFADFAPEQRAPERTTAMFFPPPVEERKRRIRYDLLAGAGLVLALLALVPLLFLRNDPEELRTTPQIPEVGAHQPGDVEIILNEPVDLTDKVELSWRANKSELDFMVLIAAEGEEDVESMFAERNLTATVDVRPGIQYCFLIQAVEASHKDDVYESDPRGLRGATCTL